MTTKIDMKIDTESAGKQAGQIARWLRRIMVENAIVRVELCHVVAGGLRPVRPWKNLDKGIDDINRLASQIDEAAQEDAYGLSEGRLQKYALLAYYLEENGEEKYARTNLQIRIAANGTNLLDGVYQDTDEPNEKGVAALLMRGYDALSRTHTIAIGRLMERYERITENQDKRIADNDKLFVEVMSTYRSMMLAEDDRKRAVKSEERREKLDEKVTDKIDTLSSVLMAHLLPPSTSMGGNGRMAKGASELQALFWWLASNQHRVPLLAQAFSQDQQAAFFKLFEFFKAGTLVASDKPEIVESLLRSILDTIDGPQLDKLMAALDDEGRRIYWKLAEVYDTSGSLATARKEEEAKANGTKKAEPS